MNHLPRLVIFHDVSPALVDFVKIVSTLLTAWTHCERSGARLRAWPVARKRAVGDGGRYTVEERRGGKEGGAVQNRGEEVHRLPCTFREGKEKAVAGGREEEPYRMRCRKALGVHKCYSLFQNTVWAVLFARFGGNLGA